MEKSSFLRKYDDCNSDSNHNSNILVLFVTNKPKIGPEMELSCSDHLSAVLPYFR